MILQYLRSWLHRNLGTCLQWDKLSNLVLRHLNDIAFSISSTETKSDYPLVIFLIDIVWLEFLNFSKNQTSLEIEPDSKFWGSKEKREFDTYSSSHVVTQYNFITHISIRTISLPSWENGMGFSVLLKINIIMLIGIIIFTPTYEENYLWSDIIISYLNLFHISPLFSTGYFMVGS